MVAPSVFQPVADIDDNNRESRCRRLYWIRIVWGDCLAVEATWAIGGGGCTLKIANGSPLW